LLSQQKKETEELDQKMSKQKEIEEEALKAAQKAKAETTRKDHESLMVKLIAVHEEERKIRDQNKAEMNSQIEKFKKEQTEKVKQQQEELKRALEDHWKKVKDELLQWQGEQTKQSEQQRQIQLEMQKKHKSDDQTIQKLITSHKEEAEELMKKQEAQIQALEKQKQSDRDQLESLFVAKIKQLEEDQKKDPLAELDSYNATNSPKPDKTKDLTRGSRSSLREKPKQDNKEKEDAAKKGTGRGEKTDK